MKIKFKSSIKEYNNYKVCHPQQTIDRIKTAFSKIGVKCFVDTWLSESVFVSTAWLENDILITAGKGATKLLSEASALGELIERFSANWMYEYDINMLKYQQYKYSTKEKSAYKNLSQNKVPIDYFFKHSGQSESSEEIKSLINDFPFHWETAYSLTEDKDIEIPYFWLRASQGTNGIASGNSLEEATLHAVYEVVERHNLERMITDKLTLPTIDPKSIKNPDLIAVMEYFHRIDIDFTIKDCTLGMPLPTIVIIFDNKNEKTEHEYLQTITKNLIAGTDPDPEIATMRCFTEYMQRYRGGFDVASEFIDKWDKLGITYKTKKNHEFYYQSLKNKRTYDVDFLLNSENIVPISSIPNKFDKDGLVELNNCIEEFKRLNIDLWLMDLTHPVLDFPVALVISPQMQIQGQDTNISGVFSRLELSRKMIDHKDKSFEFLEKYIDIPLDLKRYLLFSDWFKSDAGIKDTIEKLEAYICHFPMEIDFFFDKFIYEILVYLHLNIGNYERAKAYCSLLPDFFKIIPNNQKTHELMINYARIEYFLTAVAQLPPHPKSNGILKIMSASGVSFDIDEQWANLGHEDSENPFGIYNFGSENYKINDDICIWKKVKVEDMK